MTNFIKCIKPHKLPNTFRARQTIQFRNLKSPYRAHRYWCAQQILIFIYISKQIYVLFTFCHDGQMICNTSFSLPDTPVIQVQLSAPKKCLTGHHPRHRSPCHRGSWAAGFHTVRVRQTRRCRRRLPSAATTQPSEPPQPAPAIYPKSQPQNQPDRAT